jgi:hypothetical protein
MFWKLCSSCWSSHLLQEGFLSALIHSPLSGRRFWSFNWYQSRFGSFGTLTSLRSKNGVPGTGIGSSALRGVELTDVAKTDGCVPPWQGTDPLGRYNEHNLCSPD